MALNRSLVRQEIYWLEGRWVKKGEALEAPRSLGELIDSDHDGYDDFTEIKFHCDPTNPDSNPAHYFEAKGSNRVIFYSTNAKAVHRWENSVWLVDCISWLWGRGTLKNWI